MTALREAVEWGGQILGDQGFESPLVEVEAILGGLLNVSRVQLYLNPRLELPGDLERHFKDLISRRSQREPVAYLLGSKNFYGLEFKVSPSVMIPRPETEMLVEQVMGSSPDIGRLRRPMSGLDPITNILEIGTGSGCIAVALARLRNGVSIVATDVSEEALYLARINAVNHGVAEKIHFLKSDLTDQLSRSSWGYFDIIVSNPPYISSSKLNQLESDLHYEPRLALDGGVEGISVIKPLVETVGKFLKPNGKLMIEIGFDQGVVVSDLFKNCGFQSVQVSKDVNGHDRIVSGTPRGSI